MIVDPDFLDHWKTRTLVGLLDGDECAPLYVLRLWGHCQNRRQASFENLSSEALKSLCRFPGHANKLEASLATSGFIRREDRTLIVCNWSDYNASLIASWNNGRKGGRPPKNPGDSDEEPTGKPTGSRVDKSREDMNREEKIGSGRAPRPRFSPPSIEEIQAYCAERGNSVDAQRFFDHYSANGWVQGRGKPIKDWRAAVRTWEKNNFSSGQKPQKTYRNPMP